ncbi:hypothetical protein S4054249_06500 [Pseudoalteromonas luteoviolacea]|uniref:Beta-lactamase-related domain-containing protein n=1 Tax=Pseudoalteromonas luteoviolacea S4054 TaxID=1129367 RepID=A0A0F6A7D0_9GAMM|nr:hypothetical protein S4054249_06500 [Pseudoalteromonas luteoviolacea]AOT12429.1 hypothetical protein S40542_06500 [Pseudoalteromonas luteoviolacea]AOT17343.1 hypothetical protein S4054_06500 [Pseudoalteromonas luteoviolacea]KKE82028.1 hypothetical protein N479_20635 [Pseudoalteromonas luteoviolacea S4054]KZN74222.1 hypothetical protein N481_09580 [Pseudoalteromonas luteoviolacea S4047-1]
MAHRLVVFIALWLQTGCMQNDLSFRDKLIHQVENNAQLHGIPAQAVLVNDNGDITFKYAFEASKSRDDSTLNEHSVFPIFSVSKLFATVLVFQLVEKNSSH